MAPGSQAPLESCGSQPPRVLRGHMEGEGTGIGGGEAAFLCGYGLRALEPGSALPEGQMQVTGEQPQEGPVLGGLWKEPETARTPGHPKVTQGKCLQRCVLDSAELEGAHRGSSGDPRDHARPRAGNLSACRRVSTSFGIWGWRDVAKLKGRPQRQLLVERYWPWKQVRRWG